MCQHKGSKSLRVSFAYLVTTNLREITELSNSKLGGHLLNCVIGSSSLSLFSFLFVLFGIYATIRKNKKGKCVILFIMLKADTNLTVKGRPWWSGTDSKTNDSKLDSNLDLDSERYGKVRLYRMKTCSPAWRIGWINPLGVCEVGLHISLQLLEHSIFARLAIQLQCWVPAWGGVISLLSIRSWIWCFRFLHMSVLCPALWWYSQYSPAL